MAKRPIQWHKECLKNCKRTLQDKIDDIERMKTNAARMAEHVEQLEAQIARAIAEGRDGFDADKFNVKKGGE